ncbi:MAG: hypothetical protein IT165_32045 [Bryobacterales bacterium]|nr:hypothetical protein [Bryobacterales bacterium]
MNATPGSGLIGLFGLTDWWSSFFTPAERDRIEVEYTRGRLTTGSTNLHPLTSGKVLHTSITSTRLLHEIGCAAYGTVREKALGVFDKAEKDGQSKLRLNPTYVLDLHFLYHSMIQLNYRDREKFPDALQLAVDAYRKQISIAPRAAEVFKREWRLVPLPLGFWQLAVILEKRRNYAEAVELAMQALQQGWDGDWEKRIARCKRRMAV